jgi:GWxTD domain-containing protein
MFVPRSKTAFFAVFFLFFLGWSGLTAFGQDKDSKDQKNNKNQQTTDQTNDQNDPLKRPLTEKQKKEREKQLHEELSTDEKQWLQQDVKWIITSEEEKAFKQLTNHEEREQFIEQFWLRRDPTPDTPENEFKEEHYRRIAYANEHYSAGMAGMNTDRGHMYIVFGKPDGVESHPMGGPYVRPMSEGGGDTQTYPFEVWNYRYLEGIGQNIDIEFVDQCSCGDYKISIDPNEKDALLRIPNAGLTLWEQMGMNNKADRLRPFAHEGPGAGLIGSHNEFDAIEMYANLMRPPEVKFKDLEELVSHKVRYNMISFSVEADFVRVTDDTVLVPITIGIKNRDITFAAKEGIQTGVVNIFGRVTTLTGRIAQTFEDTVKVDVPNDLLARTLDQQSLYWKAVPLKPGRYRLDIAIKDVNGDRMGNYTKGFVVPAYDEDKLAMSSLILADVMEAVPTKDIGTGNFIIGSTKVRPRLSAAGPVVFKHYPGAKANFWMQVYNIQFDEKTKKPSATIDYAIVNTTSNQSVVKMTESTDTMQNPGTQLTLQKSLPLEKLPAGTYKITITVNDNVSKQTIAANQTFVVE